MRVHTVSTNLDEIGDATLPPREPDGRPRLLFLNIDALGLKTLGRRLEQATAVRDDVHAVHVRLDRRVVVRVLGARIKLLGCWDFAMARNASAWRRVLRHWFRSRLPLERFDAIHCCTQRHAPAVLDVRGARTSPRLAVNIDATRMEQCNGAPSLPDRRIIALEHRVFHAADRIYAWSGVTAQSVAAHYGVEESRIGIVPPSVPEFAIAEDARAGRSVDDRLQIVFVGVEFERKGGPDLLRWHQQHLVDVADLHIVSSRVKADQTLKSVHWYNFIPNEELTTRFLPSMDLMVLPTYRDHSPFVLAEGAMAGLARLSTRVGGIPELINDGITGFLTEPGNERQFVEAVKRLAMDRALCSRMGAAARLQALREFSSEKNHNRVIDEMIALATHDARVPE